MEFFKYCIKNSSKILALFTIFVTITSQILSMVVYFRIKSSQDYYFITDKVRKEKKYSFNYEYIITMMFILSILLLIMSFDPLKNTINNYLSNFNYFFLIVIATLIVSYLLYRLFSYEDKHKGVRNRKELKKYILEKSLITTIKYSVLLFYVYLIYHFIYKYIGDKKEFCLLISTILIVIFEVSYEYYSSKIIISRNRIFNIIKYNNEKYCILEKINEEQYYAVKAICHNKKIKLYLDSWMLIPIKGQNISVEVYKKHERYFNKNLIKQRKYIFFGSYKQ